MIFYTDRFVPDNAAGCARGPLIFIRPKYRNDRGLLAHEQTHVQQWLRTGGLHSFLYLFSKKYKLAAEVEAYKEQLKYSPTDIGLFAEYISRDYNLDITPEQALDLLKSTQ